MVENLYPNYNIVNVLATYISSNSTIAYWSALRHHGLTERFPNIVFVKTTHRKRDTQILGSTVKFVTVKVYYLVFVHFI